MQSSLFIVVVVVLLSLVASAPLPPSGWINRGQVHVRHCVSDDVFQPLSSNRGSRVVLKKAGLSFEGWVLFELNEYRMYAITNRFGLFFMSFSPQGNLSLVSGELPNESEIDLTDSRLFVRISVPETNFKKDVLYHPATQNFVQSEGVRPTLTPDVEIASPLCLE